MPLEKFTVTETREVRATYWVDPTEAEDGQTPAALARAGITVREDCDARYDVRSREIVAARGEVDDFRNPAGPPVRARAWTDDRVVSAEMDVACWFGQATDQDIRELHDEGWGCGRKSDEVLYFMETIADPGARSLMGYLAARNPPACAEVGFECDVNKADALAWLREHRPELHADLAPAADPPPEADATAETAVDDTWARVELFRWQHGVLPGGLDEGEDASLDEAEGLRKMADAVEHGCTHNDTEAMPTPSSVWEILRYCARRADAARPKPSPEPGGGPLHLAVPVLSNGYESAPASHILVCVDPAALARDRERCRPLLEDADFRCYGVEVYRHFRLADVSEEGDNTARDAGGDEVVAVPEPLVDTAFPEPEDLPIDCRTMVLMREGVVWTFHLKHAAAGFETEVVSWDRLAELQGVA